MMKSRGFWQNSDRSKLAEEVVVLGWGYEGYYNNKNNNNHRAGGVFRSCCSHDIKASDSNTFAYFLPARIALGAL